MKIKWRCHFCGRKVGLCALARLIVATERGPFPLDVCATCAGAWLSRFLDKLTPTERRLWLSTPLYPDQEPDER